MVAVAAAVPPPPAAAAAAAVAAAAAEAAAEAPASNESPKIDAYETKPLAAYNRFGHKAPQASRPAVDHSGSLGKPPRQ